MLSNSLADYLRTKSGRRQFTRRRSRRLFIRGSKIDGVVTYNEDFASVKTIRRKRAKTLVASKQPKQNSCEICGEDKKLPGDSRCSDCYAAACFKHHGKDQSVNLFKS